MCARGADRALLRGPSTSPLADCLASAVPTCHVRLSYRLGKTGYFVFWKRRVPNPSQLCSTPWEYDQATPDISPLRLLKRSTD